MVVTGYIQQLGCCLPRYLFSITSGCSCKEKPVSHHQAKITKNAWRATNRLHPQYENNLLATRAATWSLQSHVPPDSSHAAAERTSKTQPAPIGYSSYTVHSRYFQTARLHDDCLSNGASSSSARVRCEVLAFLLLHVATVQIRRLAR